MGKKKRTGLRYLRPAFLFAAVVLILGYLLIRPTARLADKPPAEFTNPRAEWDASRKAVERELALAYWQRAEIDVQWHHSYGSELPEQPPEGFKIDTRQFRGNPAALAESRVRYWRRLRKVWSRPETWETSYEWNTEWVTKILDAVFH